MRVTAGKEYIYHPNLLDTIDGRTGLRSGDAVRVVNLPGCPKANTMQHCHVEDVHTREFIGLVHVNSLHSKAEATLISIGGHYNGKVGSNSKEL
jgi:hypothetical protein